MGSFMKQPETGGHAGPNIFLCGFMGCGKTTVGRALGELWGARFVDMDAYIEERAGMRVASIFEAGGEARFRALEAQAARELGSMRGLVVGTGGGAALNPENVAAFKGAGTGLLVLLEVPFSLLLKRLAADARAQGATRPLLAGGEEAVRHLYEARLPVYRAAADLSACNPDDRPAAQMAREIAAALAKRG